MDFEVYDEDFFNISEKSEIYKQDSNSDEENDGKHPKIKINNKNLSQEKFAKKSSISRFGNDLNLD